MFKNNNERITAIMFDLDLPESHPRFNTFEKFKAFFNTHSFKGVDLSMDDLYNDGSIVCFFIKDESYIITLDTDTDEMSVGKMIDHEKCIFEDVEKLTFTTLENLAQTINQYIAIANLQ